MVCGLHVHGLYSLIARFIGPTWGPSGADRTQVGPMLAPWTLLSGLYIIHFMISKSEFIIWSMFHLYHFMPLLYVASGYILLISYYIYIYARADSRFAPSQWETALLCNDVSHWLGVGLESAMYAEYIPHFLIYYTLSLIARKGPWYCFLVNLKIHAVYILPNYK